jgi:glycosyltransferase involved in cell wall biosynthesis
MRDARPLVSVLINNYNYGRFLRDAIDSALNQTYSNVEVIVVDDGSTDNSREIIGSYGNRIIPVLKVNGGQASALNAGFAASKGSLICLLDSDDVWLPTKAERVIEASLSHPEAVLICHRVQPTSARLRPIHKVFPVKIPQGDISARVKRTGGWWACPPSSAQCFPRSVLERIGPVPEQELRTASDAFLSYLLPFMGSVTGLRETLALYRRHGENDSSTLVFGGETPERKAFLAHLGRYERSVAAANARLESLGVGVTLKLEDHWGYQFLRYRTGLPGCLSRAQLVCRALRHPGEPAAINRLKLAARSILQSRLLEPG